MVILILLYTLFNENWLTKKNKHNSYININYDFLHAINVTKNYHKNEQCYSLIIVKKVYTQGVFLFSVKKFQILFYTNVQLIIPMLLLVIYLVFSKMKTVIYVYINIYNKPKKLYKI